MDPVGQKLLELAKKELGYSERSDGTTKFGEWWTKNIDADHDSYFNDAPWCDMFISYLSDQAGTTSSTGLFASTPKHAQWFKDQKATASKPEPGAIVFYDWSGGKDVDGVSHVGIITKVYSDGTFQALEGNADDQVMYKTRSTDQVAVYGLPGKVKVAPVRTETSYTPKHAAPAPTPQQYMTDSQSVLTTSGQAQDVSEPSPHELPIKEAALTGAIGIAVLAVLALGVAKAAAVRVPAAVAAAPEVRVRKKGRHHRTSGAPPVELPAGMNHYDFEEAEQGTMMMPALSAAVAAEVEDREFWGRIQHLKDDEDFAFWTDMHTAVTATHETNAELTSSR
ncbi:CHAP domain-containing protein [Actinocorallia longicatena]|uniref:Peptidase C51 domain-containing protein n=1 Tax=Actinocorallia longicatena TaxID=111803 RepID=A0ABP6PXK7_9ACTN